MSMSEIQQAIQDADTKFSKMARELESLRQENSRLREVLEFYADAENYHAICFLFDPPCGGFAEDFDTDFDCYGTGGGQYDRPMPGKLARKVLNPPKNR